MGSGREERRRGYDSDAACIGPEEWEATRNALDLSISLRAGGETNLDFPSSGERTGSSTYCNDGCVGPAPIPSKGEPAVVIAHGGTRTRLVLLGSAV